MPFYVSRGFSPARAAERRAAGRDILPRIALRSHGFAAREKFCHNEIASLGAPHSGVLFCVPRGFSPARVAERRAAGRDILPRIALRSHGFAAREKFCQIKAVSVGRHPDMGCLFMCPVAFRLREPLYNVKKSARRNRWFSPEKQKNGVTDAVSFQKSQNRTTKSENMS